VLIQPNEGVVMRLLYRIASYLLLIGVIHTALTPAFYDGLTLDALWFAGTGLALVFLSLLNIVAERAFEPWMLNLCIVANLAGLVHSVLIVTQLSEIQAVVGLLIFIAATVGSVCARLSVGSRR
jgi:hypothetical protein